MQNAYYYSFPMGNQLVQIQNWLVQEPIPNQLEITGPSVVWKTQHEIIGSILIGDTVEKNEGKGDWVVKDLSNDDAIKIHDFMVVNTGPVLLSPHLCECLDTMTERTFNDWGMVNLIFNKGGSQ